MVRSRARSRSRTPSSAARASSTGCAAASRPRVTGPSSFTARPTASPTVITSASGTWRWRKDPWEARDSYVDVVLDRTPQRLYAWLARHQRAALDDAAHMEVRRLLEMQRNRMLMCTSCGWFFDELSGLEPVQILKYAAMAIQYLRDLGGGVIEPEFVRRLEAAPSNVRDYGDGGEVYRRLIQPAVVDWRRVRGRNAIA